MGDTLNALQAANRSSSVLGAIANPTVANPLAAMQGAAQTAGTITQLRQRQFDLQQAQLQPGYQSMRMLMATNPDPSNDDVLAALGSAARIGGNVDGLVQNFTDFMARNPKAKPADFMRATALGGMSPESQGILVGPHAMSQQTAAGTYYGTTPGLWAPGAGTFQPGGFAAKGLSPTEQMQPYTVMGPDGTPITVPAGDVYGGGGGGGAGGPAGGGGGGGAANNALNIRFIGQPGATNSGGFAAFATPEAGQAATDALFGKYADSGINTISGLISRWAPPTDNNNTPAYIASVAKATGLDPNAPINLKDPAVARKIQQAMAVVEGNKNASVAPLGGGGGTPASGAFIGATSAQPVAGGDGNVQPAGGGGGMQYLPASPGGGGGAPGGGGGGVLAGGYTLPSPGLQPELDAGAKQHAADIGNLATLPTRIQPLMSALNVLKANPDLTTGAGQDQWNTWMGALKGMGLPLPAWAAADKTPAWQELGKYLMQNTRAMPGANQSDMSRVQAEVSSPHIDQQRDAIMELSARQVGLERFQLAGLKYFDSQFSDPTAAASHSGTYRLTTAPWLSKLDPTAFAADLMEPKATQQYYQSLTKPQQARYRESLVAAKQLFGIQLPIPQGGNGGG